MSKIKNTKDNMNRPAAAKPVNVPATWDFQEDNWVGALDEDLVVVSPEGLEYNVRKQIARKMWVAEALDGFEVLKLGAPVGMELGFCTKLGGRYLTSLGFNEA